MALAQQSSSLFLMWIRHRFCCSTRSRHRRPTLVCHFSCPPPFAQPGFQWYSWEKTLSDKERSGKLEYLDSVRRAKRENNEKEVKRLQEERHRYTYRRWYMNNRETELVKIRERKARRSRQMTCCSKYQLGSQSPPTQGFTMWLTRCRTCQHEQYCVLGFDPAGRSGVYFRGLWFASIDPTTGMGTTIGGKNISIT